VEQRQQTKSGTLVILRYPGSPIVRFAPPLFVAGAVASVARLPMSCCPVGAAARAPVLVRAGGSSKGKGGMAMAAVRRAMPSTRSVAAAAASSSAGARTSSAVAAAGALRTGSSGGAVSKSKVAWGAGAASRGYASGNVFKNNNIVAKAVAGAETAVEGEEVAPPIKLLTSDESPELLKIRHTSAHICAMAVQTLFPTAQATIGPWCAPIQ